MVTDEHRDALKEFLRAFDTRTAAAPIVERRAPPATEIFNARRAKGPVDGGFAYWVSPNDHKQD